MADDLKAPLTEVQRQRIKDTPWHKSSTPTWKNPITGETERMELSHEPEPFSRGGTKVTPRWPEDHALKDHDRHLSRKVREAYENEDTKDKIRKAFGKEIEEWGYKIDKAKM